MRTVTVYMSDGDTDAEFDAFVAKANKYGFRELVRKLMIVWVSGCYSKQEPK